jgi:hypothetical protein
MGAARFETLVSYRNITRRYDPKVLEFEFFKRHLQSFADLWPTLTGFSIYT